MLIKNTLVKEKKERCRFDLFVRVKETLPARFLNGKKEFCFRGDKHDTEPAKMIRYLLGIVKNHHRQYNVMELYDNTKPKTDRERVIVKVLNGQVKINRLTLYTELLKDFHLPEILSYEITD